VDSTCTPHGVGLQRCHDTAPDQISLLALLPAAAAVGQAMIRAFKEAGWKTMSVGQLCTWDCERGWSDASVSKAEQRAVD